ncbi:hypothetical protein [Rhodopseudomonas sp. BR0M22]|uniref:hypothetical protein n=1 Tax=Rhodopseudomonas sp. BR0M22 TaxID=2269369 RepID=UPI0013DE957F|nr:hypothetical protein [Rhodopseudomonas sp. BR0M22]
MPLSLVRTGSPVVERALTFDGQAIVSLASDLSRAAHRQETAGYQAVELETLRCIEITPRCARDIDQHRYRLIAQFCARHIDLPPLLPSAGNVSVVDSVPTACTSRADTIARDRIGGTTFRRLGAMDEGAAF